MRKRRRPNGVSIGGDNLGAVVLGRANLVFTFVSTRVHGTQDTALPPLDAMQERVTHQTAFLWGQTLAASLTAAQGELAVDLSPQQDAVAKQLADAPLESLADNDPYPRGHRLIDVLRRNDRFLVVGEPGAGKTTQLLRLAEDLVDAHDRDAADDRSGRRAPVVLLLSTWQDQSMPFIEWLYLEQTKAYGLPRAGADLLLRRGGLHLLLDGLDEIGLDLESDPRLDSLQQFLADGAYGLNGVVITCRSAEYVRYGRRLRLFTGVRIRPLEAGYVLDLLNARGPDGRAVVSALLRHDMLALVQTPLVLILLLSSGVIDGGIPDSAWQSKEAFTAFVIAAEERSLFERDRALLVDGEPVPTRGAERFSPQVTHDYLVNLAVLMRRLHFTAFMIDDLAPDWLPKVLEAEMVPRMRRGPFRWLASRVGLDRATTGSAGAFLGLVLGPILLAPAALFLLGRGVGLIIGGAAALGLAAGAFALLSVFSRLRWSPVFAYLLGSYVNVPKPAVNWQWIRRRALNWAPVAALAGGVVGALALIRHDGHTAVAAGLVVAVVASLPAGLTDDLTPRRYPGQAIRNSTRWLWSVLAVFVGVGALLAGGAVLAGADVGILAVVPLALIPNVIFGPGRALLRAMALRYGIARADLFPGRFTTFLEHACTVGLLLPKGAGYSFRHAKILDHFATRPALELAPPPNRPAEEAA